VGLEIPERTEKSVINQCFERDYIVQTCFHVLIVNDSAIDARLVTRTLRKHWLNVDTHRATNEQDVQKAFAEASWDCVLCDMNVPGFDATRVLKIIQNKAQDLPFIIISDIVHLESAVGLLRDGARDFIEKDNLARLVPAIEKALSSCENQRQQRETEAKLIQSERLYRDLFNSSAVSLWNEDLSAVYLELEKLRAQGLKDLRAH
jgi:DNA-binding NtrC family response regulator